MLSRSLSNMVLMPEEPKRPIYHLFYYYGNYCQQG
jgi:hypothetical protein